jgi:hypothetical protein
MSGGSPKKPTKPPAGTTPRGDKRQKEPGTIPVTPINPPAVGGGTVPGEERPKKK